MADERNTLGTPDLGEILVSFRRSVMNTTEALMAPYGLSVEEFAVLNALRIRGPSPVSRLAYALNYDAGRVGRYAYRLTQEGLIRSRRPRSDRRIIELRVTPRGEELVKEIDGVLQEAYAELLAGVSDADMRRFVSTMHLIRSNSLRMRDAALAAAAEASDPDGTTDS